MATIYRVESAEGYGPYNTDQYPWGHYSDMYDLMKAVNLGSAHPMPAGDGIEMRPDFIDDRFGFESCDQLRAWFDARTLAGIARFGYQPYAYEVPDGLIVKGGHQLVFDAAFSRRLGPVSV